MAKSKIIKELANNEITLEVALSRLLIIATDIGNDKLLNWAESELNGYKNNEVPEYRVVVCGDFIYSGIAGRFQVTKCVFPYINLIKKYVPDAFNVPFCDGVVALEGFVNSKNNPRRDFTYLSGKVLSETGISCTNISQVISTNDIQNIISKIKTIIIKVLFKLENTYGNLDDMDIDIGSVSPEIVDETNRVINNYIYIDNSVKVGDKNKIDSSDILGGGK